MSRQTMRGWRSEERSLVTNTLLDQALEVVQAKGFRVSQHNVGHVILTRGNRPNSPSIDKVPLELALAESEAGLFLQLRYASFVAFDTGDLGRLADELSAAIDI